MAYETTKVPVARSQEVIRKLIMSHGGFGLAFVSDRDPANGAAQEGFQAKVLIDKKPYTVKIMAKLKAPGKYDSVRQQAEFISREECRVWRVLYYHLKSVFEAADSGVMEFRELMLPYIMIGDKSVAEHIIPRLDEAVADPTRMLSQ